MVNLEIRDVTTADIPGVKDIYSSWMTSEEMDQIAFFTNLVVQSVSDPKAEERYFVATQRDGVPIGIVGYRTTQTRTLATFADTRKPLQLTVLMVHKTSSSKGIGSALLDYIENFAGNQEYSEVLLSSSERWKDSWGFYEKSGYRDLGEMPNTHEWHTRMFSKRIS